MSPVTNGSSGGVSQLWSVSYQLGLPCLVSLFIVSCILLGLFKIDYIVTNGSFNGISVMHNIDILPILVTILVTIQLLWIQVKKYFVIM